MMRRSFQRVQLYGVVFLAVVILAGGVVQAGSKHDTVDVIATIVPEVGIDISAAQKLRINVGPKDGSIVGVHEAEKPAKIQIHHNCNINVLLETESLEYVTKGKRTDPDITVDPVYWIEGIDNSEFGPGITPTSWKKRFEWTKNNGQGNNGNNGNGKGKGSKLAKTTLSLNGKIVVDEVSQYRAGKYRGVVTITVTEAEE